MVAWLYTVWPPPSWYRTHWPKETAFMGVRRAEGSPVRAYHPVPLDSIAPVVQTAVLTGEDARFWNHTGVDFLEVRRALGYRRERFEWTSGRDRAELWRIAARTLVSREGLRGASTITQQVAKNLYLSPSRSLLR